MQQTAASCSSSFQWLLLPATDYCCDIAGRGLDAILPAIIEQIPPPTGRPDGKLKLLLFDAYHDEYRGVICLVSPHTSSSHTARLVGMSQYQ